MTATDPDFLSLVEANRFQPSTANVTSPKVRARLQERKKAYWNEIICLRPVPPPSSASLPSEHDSKEWNIPRFRLTESFLQETVNRAYSSSSSMVLLSHVHDRKTNSVILPKDLQVKSQSSVIYDVVVRSAVQVEQGGVLSGDGDSYYKGDIIIYVRGVPNLSESERYEVVPDDVHRWLVDGATNGLEEIQIHNNKVKTLVETLEQFEKDLKNINAVPIYNEHGRAVVGSPLKDARETKFKFLMDKKEQTKNRILQAQESEEAAHARHFSACSLLITKRSKNGVNVRDKSSKALFAVKVLGKKREFYEKIITNATDWALVHLYATGDRTTETKSKKKQANDEGKSATMVTIAEADRGDHLVDVGAVSIEILPDGFGVHEAYTEFDLFATNINVGNVDSRCYHKLFHGHFQEGKYCEGTLHTDVGVYSGTFVSNEPCKGKMKYSDEIILTGDFAMPPEHRGDRRYEDEERGEEYNEDSPLGQNPYRRGVPHGNVHIQFKDGASYEGEMHHGNITGNGIYRYPRDGTPLDCRGRSSAKKGQDAQSFIEIEGDFVNGILRNNDGVEGQGGSNLLRSLMFDGERSWSP